MAENMVVKEPLTADMIDAGEALRLLDGSEKLVRQLQTAVRTGAGISRIRFRKNVADGHYIEDALIYRVA